ncbi:hypothetical protein [Burkholderia ubonensis]|uniref:hypothetical protein n=1 Tax=Burkholderia ubonensis TaxID=101571 RepID=UPI0018DFFB5D|nr:hypothetical protein [Burkholderia ubonensis]
MVTEIEVPRQIRRARDFMRAASQCEFQAFAERRFFFGCRHGAIVHFGRHAPGNRLGEMYPAGWSAATARRATVAYAVERGWGRAM